MKSAALLAAIVALGGGILFYRQHQRAARGDGTAEIQSSDDGPRAELRPGEVDVFSAPRLIAGMAQGMTVTQELFAKKDYASAETLLAALVRAEPRIGVNHYNLACAQAQLGRTDAALVSLRAAVANGFRDAGHIAADADLVSLRGLPEFQAIVGEARQPAPQVDASPKFALGTIRDGVALVARENTAVSMALGALVSGFQLDPQDPRRNAVAVKGLGKAGQLVRQWQKEGSAAGLFGVLYDNHDRDHSTLAPAEFPQLSFVQYSTEARREGLDHGLQVRFLFNLPTLGNSSTAQTGGALWRSQPRTAQTQPAALTAQAAQYLGNHLYVYPEHRDYDTGHNGAGGGWGDVFPANTPYCFVTRGSSGSDLPMLRALATTLAAFQPATHERLLQSRLLAPTLQMILRRSYRPVGTLEDYFTGRAHPAAFDVTQLEVERMVRMAHALAPEELPPLVRLAVKEEDGPRPGVDYVDATPGEVLFDTPCAVARVWQRAARSWRMVLNAEGSLDANERPLTYRWALLQGDPARVKIAPLTPNGSVAELRVQWHERFVLPTADRLASNRVDIGVFASNGAQWSAPAFVTFYCPDSVTRRYDAADRPLSLEHRPLARGGNYADPLAHTPRDWRDDFHYDAAGALLGWTRTRAAVVEDFTVDGRLVVEKDEHGRPLTSRAVRYVTETTAQGPMLRQEVTDTEFRYGYHSADDRRGVVIRSAKPGTGAVSGR